MYRSIRLIHSTRDTYAGYARGFASARGLWGGAGGAPLYALRYRVGGGRLSVSPSLVDALGGGAAQAAAAERVGAGGLAVG